MLTLVRRAETGGASAAEIVGCRVGPPSDEMPERYTVRSVRPTDVAALGRLYVEAYDPGVACATLEEAVADMRASFGGEYGELLEMASPVATLDAELVAAVLTVRRAPWEDTPDCPFIIEAFTDRAHRRRGLGRALVTYVLAEVARRRESHVALRVAADNVAARELYRSLGFRTWEA
jgi:N-alpha-acetyltransferase 10/11